MPEKSRKVLGSDSDEAQTARVVDMQHPGATFTNQLPDMGMVQERLFRSMRANIFQVTRQSITVHDDPSDIVAHDEFLSGDLPSAVMYGIIEMPPIRGLALAMVDGALLAALVDNLFGATQTMARAGDARQSGELSNMELRIGNRLMDIIVRTLDETFQAQIPVAMTLLRVETHSALASVAEAADPYLIMPATISLSTGEGHVKIALPYRGLEPHREALTAPIGSNVHNEADVIWQDQIRTALGEASLEIGIEVGTSNISVHVLKALSVDDVLPLKLHDGARLVCGGVSVAAARYGSLAGNYGVMIDDE